MKWAKSNLKILSRSVFLGFCAFALCAMHCTSANAIQLNSTGRVGVRSITVKDGNGGTDGWDLIVDAGSGLGRGNKSNATNIRDIYIQYNENIPGNSITAVTISISGKWAQPDVMKFTGAIGNAYWGLIDQDCVSNIEPGGDGRYVTTCTMWYFTSVPDSQINLAPSDNSRIFNVGGEYSITVQAGTYYRVTDAQAYGLDVRRNEILDGLESKVAFQIIPELQAIKDAIKSSDVAGVKDSIDEGNKAAQDRWDEENKKAEEAQNTEVDTGAEGSGDASTSAWGLITDIINTKATTCELDGIEAFGFKLGKLDMCANKPPGWLSGTIAVVVMLVEIRGAIAITRRILEEMGTIMGGTRG